MQAATPVRAACKDVPPRSPALQRTLRCRSSPRSYPLARENLLHRRDRAAIRLPRFLHWWPPANPSAALGAASRPRPFVPGTEPARQSLLYPRQCACLRRPGSRRNQSIRFARPTLLNPLPLEAFARSSVGFPAFGPIGGRGWIPAAFGSRSSVAAFRIHLSPSLCPNLSRTPAHRLLPSLLRSRVSVPLQSMRCLPRVE